MEETFNIQAIILNRHIFRENDSRVLVYSKEHGKMFLVARGARSIKSKMAGHIEPFCLSDLMVVRGKNYNYIGGAKSGNCFRELKSDLKKLEVAGRSFAILNKIIKEHEVDPKLFFLINDFLEALSDINKNIDSNLFLHAFILKLICQLGYRPELYSCVICRKDINPNNNYFDFKRGGLVCSSCRKNSLTIHKDSIKLLRFIVKENFKNISKLHFNKKISLGAIKNIVLFYNYNFK
ncbi:DNA repair protein RecO [Candidatus Parcubacteria bacterium]|nr:DNA repair protein RecO [Candidatus Parcubacteria bacterium]